MVSASTAQKKRVTTDKKYAQNVTKRGLISAELAEKKPKKLPVGPLMLGFFLFVVVGSSLLQIFKTAGSADKR